MRVIYREGMRVIYREGMMVSYREGMMVSCVIRMDSRRRDGTYRLGTWGTLWWEGFWSTRRLRNDLRGARVART